jgi:hypothetical protein
LGSEARCQPGRRRVARTQAARRIPERARDRGERLELRQRLRDDPRPVRSRRPAQHHQLGGGINERPAKQAGSDATGLTPRQIHIIDRLRRYAELYGDDFTTAAFAPATATWRAEPHLIDRYYAGDPDTGERWPSLNSVKDAFGGSFNAARVAAGFAPNRAGQKKNRRPKGANRPIRDVRHKHTIIKDPEARAERDDLRVRVRELERELAAEQRSAERAEGMLETALKRLDAARKARDREVRRAATAKRSADRARRRGAREPVRVRARPEIREVEVVREVEVEVVREVPVSNDAAMAAAEARATAAEDQATAALRDLEVERDHAEGARQRMRAAERKAAEALERAEDAEAAAARATPDARVDAAERAVAAAERRAGEAENRMRELAVVVTGRRDVLTPEQVAELRGRGPAGPGVLAGALEQLARARATNNPLKLDEALTRVAAAAVRWRDRMRSR